MNENEIPEINISLAQLQEKAKELENKPHYFLAKNQQDRTFVVYAMSAKDVTFISRKTGKPYQKMHLCVSLDGQDKLLDSEFAEAFFEKYGKHLDGKPFSIKSIKDDKGFYNWVVL